MIAIFLATYVAIFIAEIAGDKLLYTTGVLATRYRALPILCGMTIAFMAKMAVAVLVGSFIARLPPLVVAAVTAINFFLIAYAVWRNPDKEESEEEYPSSRAVLVSFAAIFFSEWGDVGQMTKLSRRVLALWGFGEPLWVWLGAVTAMITKGALAASIGAGLREWIQKHVSPVTLKYAAVTLLLFFSVLTVLETLIEVHEISG